MLKFLYILFYLAQQVKLLERNRNRAKEIYYLLIGFLER
nr:MAG TPA: hypothetical protein [Caudoviricetes sp.]